MFLHLFMLKFCEGNFFSIYRTQGAHLFVFVRDDKLTTLFQGVRICGLCGARACTPGAQSHQQQPTG
jgi:hypothetical protein